VQTPPVNLLTWLLALSPIAAVLALMVGFRWGSDRAGAVGWIVALLAAWLGFRAGPQVLLFSQLRGLLLSLYVLYIIWMALLLYRVVAEAGAIAVIGQGIVRLTAQPTMQLLLLAWAFASFLQGVSGYGVPIAVVAPLLIGLGFPPVVAVAAVSIGHSWSVTFGSVAASFQALTAASNLPGSELAPWSALFLGVACLGCGIYAAWAWEGGRSLRQGWPALLLMGGTMAGVQAALALSGLWSLAGFGAGLAGLAVGALVARLPRYQRAGSQPEATRADSQPAPQGGNAAACPRAPSGALPLGLALAPYLALIVAVAAAELWPWLNGVLNRIQIQVRFPGVSTGYGWATPAGLGRTTSVFGHAGALLAYVAVAFFLVYRLVGRYTPGVEQRILRKTLRSALPSSIGILTMVGFAVAMDNSGMVYVLAQGLGRAAGPLYPVVAPFIGLLGAFMTGSNTNSNVVFAPLQQQAAGLLQISAAVILAAQTTGGAVGSALAPAKLIVGCSTAGLVGQEGKVLIKILLPGLLIIGLVGVLAWLAIALGAR
jgi:lactate permease